MELGHDREHQVVVACQAGEIVDEDDIEGFGLSGLDEGGEAGAILAGARLGLVGVDVLFDDVEAALERELATGGDLILDALWPLVLGAVSGVDGWSHLIPPSL